MKCVVTGGLGFVGSNLVDELVRQGHEVYVFDNLATGYMENLNPKVGLYQIDIRTDLCGDGPSDDPLYMCGEMGMTPDVIFHLAALARIQPSFRRPHETLSVNCEGTARVLDFARATGARVVYAGSSSFYAGPHKNPYAYSKWVGEEHCKMYNKVYGVSVAIARFFNVFGKRMERVGENAAVLGIFEHQYMNKQPLTITGTGDRRRDFTHIDDIVSGLIAMSRDTWNGDVFNLGRGRNYSINEVAAMFKCPVTHIAERPGEAETTLADISFSKEMLGWEPVRNLPEYVEEFLRSVNG